MNPLELETGDYVEHRDYPQTIWQVRHLDPYTSTGGEAKLKWVGGKKITYEDRRLILRVYANSDVAFVSELRPANPMLVLALESS